MINLQDRINKIDAEQRRIEAEIEGSMTSKQRMERKAKRQLPYLAAGIFGLSLFIGSGIYEQRVLAESQRLEEGIKQERFERNNPKQEKGLQERILEQKQPIQPQTPETQKEEQMYCSEGSSKIDLIKATIAHQESKNKIHTKNKYSGAAGKYQYMPSTALGLIRKAKSEGIDVPYKDRMTKTDVSYVLRTDQKFNEWLADYDLRARLKMFDGNVGLVFMSYYANPEQIKQSLAHVYPGLKDYSRVSIEDFANKRAKTGNNWLLVRQANDHPSILQYGLETTNIYSRLLAMNH